MTTARKPAKRAVKRPVAKKTVKKTPAKRNVAKTIYEDRNCTVKKRGRTFEIYTK